MIVMYKRCQRKKSDAICNAARWIRWECERTFCVEQQVLLPNVLVKKKKSKSGRVACWLQSMSAQSVFSFVARGFMSFCATCRMESVYLSACDLCAKQGAQMIDSILEIWFFFTSFEMRRKKNTCKQKVGDSIVHRKRIFVLLFYY